MNLVRGTARTLLSAIFLEGGARTLQHPEGAAVTAGPMIEKVSSLHSSIPTNPATLVRINATVQVIAALMLASGRFPRIAAAVLAGSLIPTTLGGHAYWNEEDPQKRAMQRLQFAKNTSILGGLLFAVLDRGGKPSIGWRLDHLSKPNFLPD